MHRLLLVAIVALAAAGGAAVLRAHWLSRDAWEAGEARVAEYHRLPPAAPGDLAAREARRALLQAAILDFREAALWFYPGNPYVDRAAARLRTIGQRAEQSGDDGLALYAYRALRSARLAVRGPFAGGAEDLDQADRAVARVSARLAPPVPPGEEREPSSSRERRLLDQLRPEPGPSAWLAWLAVGGLAAWVGGAAFFALRGLDAECRLRRGPALGAAVVVLVGLAAWVGGLVLA